MAKLKVMCARSMHVAVGDLGKAFAAASGHEVEFDFGTNSTGTGCPGCGGGVGQGAGIIQLSVENVPEPASWALMLLGAAAIGVLMTGMGDDGAKGLLAISERGGRTLAQGPIGQFEGKLK